MKNMLLLQIRNLNFLSRQIRHKNLFCGLVHPDRSNSFQKLPLSTPCGDLERQFLKLDRTDQDGLVRKIDISTLITCPG